MGYVIGIDIGGTFTDAFAASEAGDVYATKTPSTPPDFSIGLINTLDELALSMKVTTADLLADTLYICHGTTAALNAVVTGNVARVGFIATQGHSNTLRIMNVQGRYAGMSAEHIQDSVLTAKPAPLIPARFVEEVPERIDAAARIVVALNEDHTRAAIARLIEKGVEAIAISLLWSFLNPVHEKRIREIVNEMAPHLPVALSSEISPKIREYTRSVTTVVSAQVGPKLKTYLVPLEQKLRSKGFTGSLLLMQGAGGAITASEAPDQAVTVIGSVLTGGVVGCAKLGEARGDRNIISTDMGGTTFLVGLVVDGEPIRAAHTNLNQYTISTPMVDIATIGSGGGAIAHLDPAGSLKVGPDSAGALPGPACYGEGGEHPTITDANLILGIINPANFLGGRKALYPDLARQRIKEKIADPLGLSIEDAAYAIYTIANDQAAQLIRQSVINQGYDSRDFIVYAFGGGAPAHCGYYSAEMGVKGVLIPLGSTAATFSAFGLASSDIILSAENSNPDIWPVASESVDAEFNRLEAQLSERLDRQGVPFAAKSYRREVDLRYSKQIAEVQTPVSPGRLNDDEIARTTEKFENLYEKKFGAGTGFSAAGIQAISYRAYGTGKMPVQVRLPPVAAAKNAISPIAQRKVFLDMNIGWEMVDILDASHFLHGHRIHGPAIVEGPTTTIVVPHNCSGEVDHLGNLVLTYDREI